MRLREARLRETRLIGFQLGVVLYEPVPLTERGFQIYVYDLGNTKIGVLGTDAQKSRIEEINFELTQNGCGAFSFKTAGKPAFDIDYRYRIDIHPYYSDVPWFSGFIQELPQEEVASPLKWKGFGFIEQLRWVTVTKDYASQDIADIVKDIVSAYVSPNTQIIYNPSKVETTNYIVNSVSFDHTFAREAIEKLAETAQNYNYGVDMQREFFFQPISSDITIRFIVGKTAKKARVKKDPSRIKNRLYVKAGQIQTDGTNWIGYVEDTNSINTYGLREAIITAPELLDTSDALQWANWILSQQKDPTVSATVEGVLLDLYKEKVDAVGKAELTMEDGTTYILDIKRVRYSISKDGIEAKVDLGILAVPFEEHILELLRRIEEESRLADKRTKQLYA